VLDKQAQNYKQFRMIQQKLKKINEQ